MPLLSLLGLPFRAIIVAPLKLSFLEVKCERGWEDWSGGCGRCAPSAGARVGQAWHGNQVVYGRVAATIFTVGTVRPTKPVRPLEFMPQITTSRVVWGRRRERSVGLLEGQTFSPGTSLIAINTQKPSYTSAKRRVTKKKEKKMGHLTRLDIYSYTYSCIKVNNNLVKNLKP